MALKKKKKKDLNYRETDFPNCVSTTQKSYKSRSIPSLKIVSYNIKHSKKINSAIKLLKEDKNLNDAGIICLQEMDPLGVMQIAETLKFNYVYYPAFEHPVIGKDFGNAILSKWPILEHHKIILSKENTKKTQRIAVFASIQWKGTELLIACVHMRVILHHKVRANQIVKLLKLIPSSAKNIVLAGDFNTFTKKSHEAMLKPLLENKFRPATVGVDWSYTHWYLLNKKSLLDHIFVRGLDIISTG